MKTLQKNKYYYRKFGVHKKVWQSLSHKEITLPGSDVPWLDRVITIDEIRSKPGFPDLPLSIEQVITFKNDGVLKLNGFFSKEKIETVEKSITEGLSKKLMKTYINNRLINLYKSNVEVESIFKDPQLLRILQFLLGREVLPFKTINFYKSSAQPAHSDSMYLTTEPLGYLIAVWVALEDIVPGSGELKYYPGSHKLPYVVNEDFDHGNTKWKLNPQHYINYQNKIQSLIDKHKLQPETYLPKKGDLLIWHANILHGGSIVEDQKLTRKSLVMHYFGKGVLCYHESMEKPAIIET